ncbi:F-box protein At5g07610-like [Triticum aestivum]|uniref:F-box protein At5g07610-like n=1 Tax=Triticum aestivum TaxID=4565 RepID=UPI0008451FE5|nr:F-box protein At5g07610-like [Triticum aestivum]
MAGDSKKEKCVEGSPVDKLTDDLLVDIISRVPYKATCCCKCVSTRWRDLISHPDHRKNMPQSLAGFFYQVKGARYFTNVSGEGDPFFDPSLSFLPNYQSLYILDCCNGLLLCRCWKATDPETLDYIVCNPATEKWVVVPASDWSSEVVVARLGFDSSVSSHFHVFEFIIDEASGVYEDESRYFKNIKALAIYSSKAGLWMVTEIMAISFAIPWNSRSVFLNGVLHLAAFDDLIVAVDVEGNHKRIVDLDDDFINDIFPSQRRLYFAHSTAGIGGSDLKVWVLEDHGRADWTLKHNVSNLKLFGTEYSSFQKHYNVVSFHPERNMLFIVCGEENTLMSYDMDSMELRFIRQLGSDCQVEGSDWEGKTPFLTHVPLFSESLANGH